MVPDRQEWKEKYLGISRVLEQRYTKFSVRSDREPCRP